MANKNYHKRVMVNASAEEALKKINEVKKWWEKK
jgi:hypothetical protein